MLLLTSVAVAQPGVTPPQSTLVGPPSHERSDRFFVALGLLVGGGGPSDWLYGAYTAELAATLLHDPVRLRARLFGNLVGGTMESDWSGDFSRFGGGVEARWCTAGAGTCLFGDLDIGYQKLSLRDQNSEFVRSDNGMIAGPRIGLDFGGAIRFRFALELYEHFAHHTSRSATTPSDYRSYGTFGLSFAVGYQF